MLFSRLYHLCFINKRYLIYGAGSLFASVVYFRNEMKSNRSLSIVNAETSKEILIQENQINASTGSTILLLKPYLLSEWPQLLLCLLSSIAQAVLGMYLPTATANLASWIWMSNKSRFGSPWIYFLACITGQTIMSFLNTIIVNKYCDRVVHRLQLSLYTSLLYEKTISFFDNHPTGHLMHRLTSDPQEFKHALKILLSQGVKHVTSLICGIIQLASISPKWTASMSMCIPAVMILGHSYGSVLRRASRLYHKEQVLSTGRLTQVLGHIRTVLAFLGEQFELDHYKKSLEMIQKASSNLAFHTAIYTSCMQWSIQIASMLGVLMLASPESSNSPRETLTKFLVMAQQTQWSLSQINGLYAQVLKAFHSGSRIVEWISCNSDIRSMNTNNIIQSCVIDKGPRITFDNICFSYPDRGKLFDDLSLILYPGETVAICGPSGSGKSTIASVR